MSSTNTTTTQKTRSESEIYDRQIRLWGAEAQAKISKAKVLYIHLSGVSTEICKNLVLAGVHASVCDGRKYPEEVASTPSFFLKERRNHNDNDDDEHSKRIKYSSVAHAVKHHIEELNPLLGECEIVESVVSELSEDSLKNYNMVIASNIGKNDAIRISQATTKHGGKFFLVDTFGLYGAATIDLGENHEYRAEKGKELLDLVKLEPYVKLEDIMSTPLPDIVSRVDKTPPKIWIQYQAILEYQNQTNKWPSKVESDDFTKMIQEWISKEYPSLKDLDTFSSDSLASLASTATAEVSPVCAVLGGVLGNEVIKAISGKGEPANNVLLLDGFDCKCRNVLVKPKTEN